MARDIVWYCSLASPFKTPKKQRTAMPAVINFTPHLVRVLAGAQGGLILGYVGFGRAACLRTFRLVAELPSAGVARAATSVEPAGTIKVNGVLVPLTRTAYGLPQGLPEPKLEIWLLVSKITAAAAVAAGRPSYDLLVAGEAVRDDDGNVLGVTGFGRV
jgi:hypothetical protein